MAIISFFMVLLARKSLMCFKFTEYFSFYSFKDFNFNVRNTVLLSGFQHSYFFLTSQCSAGVFVGVGHSQTEKWLFLRTLWRLDFYIQGDCF